MDIYLLGIFILFVITNALIAAIHDVILIQRSVHKGVFPIGEIYDNINRKMIPVMKRKALISLFEE